MYLITSSHDCTVKIWEYKNKTVSLIHTLTTHTNTVTSAYFSIDCTKIITSSYDCTVIVYSASDYSVLFTIDLTNAANFANFSYDGSLIAVCCSNQVIVYNAEGKKLNTLRNHIKPVICATFSPNGKLLISSSKDGSATLWDTMKWKILHCLEYH